MSAFGEPGPGTDLGPCPLCGRPMIAGPSLDRHHWIPRSKGGRRSDWLHRTCHRMIHRLFDETTLARDHPTVDSLRAHPEMVGFLTWIRKQPPEQVDWPKSPRRGKRRR